MSRTALFRELNQRTVFLVNSVALVSQQAAYIARHTGLRVRGFCGADGVDHWTRQEWVKAVEDTEVLVIVAQVRRQGTIVQENSGPSGHYCTGELSTDFNAF